MSPLPASPVIRSLVNGYPVNPGLQTAIAVKLPDPLENFDEDILQNVRCLRWVLENTRDEVEDRGLVDPQKVSEGLFGSGLQFRDQERFLIDCGKPPLERHPDGSRGVHYAHKIPLHDTDCKIALAFLVIYTDTRKRRFVPETPHRPDVEKPETWQSKTPTGILIRWLPIGTSLVARGCYGSCLPA